MVIFMYQYLPNGQEKVIKYSLNIIYLLIKSTLKTACAWKNAEFIMYFIC